tara:strand:- start:508 stop:819 length:312 start_codon:yes stop_codon:yes gene_type:complete
MPKFSKSQGYRSPLAKKIEKTGSSPFKMKGSPLKVIPAFLAPILSAIGVGGAGVATGAATGVAAKATTGALIKQGLIKGATNAIAGKAVSNALKDDENVKRII